MPREIEKKCKVVIHSASLAATAAGAIPIPMSDAIPITAAQIGMIIKLGDVFELSLSQSATNLLLALLSPNKPVVRCVLILLNQFLEDGFQAHS